MGIVIPKLRASARGQQCTLNFSCCNYDPETTVLAHLPSSIKGMANKSDDWHAVFACSACHAALDDRASTPINRYTLMALQRTQRIWFESGLMEFPITEPKPKQSAKIMARRQLGASS